MMKRTLWSSVVVLAGLSFAACGTSATSGPEARARHVEVSAGTVVSVRMDRALSTERNRIGDTFEAVLDTPLLVDGKEALPQGTRFTGHVTAAESSGRLKGRAALSMTLDAFELNGRHYPIETSTDSRTTEAHAKRNVEIIGGGAGVGALIGGVAGGGKGAAIGAAVGAGAGTGVAAETGKDEVEVAANARFDFSMKTPVSLSL
jgi:outer membrane lipoprotein SlyB